MIKRIFNWSFGAFFRTIGRTLAYLAIVLILLFIGSKLNLFQSMVVNAATEITPSSTEMGYSFYNLATGETTAEGVLTEGQTLGNSNTYVETAGGTKIRPWVYTLKPRVFYDFKSSGTYNFSFYVAVNYENTFDKTTADRFKEYMTLSVRASNKSNGSSADTSNINSYKCDFIQSDESAGRFYINCNVSFKSDMKYIVFFFYMKSQYKEPGNYNYSLAITNLRYDSLTITYDESAAGAINNQTQVIIQGNTEINNNITNIQDSINDSNIDDANDVASGFFNNFDTEDHGGLSSIVRAPLNAVNSMLSGTCEPMTATFKGKTMSLPCGDILWNRPNADGLKAFINLVFGGPICYGILIGFYKMIERLKNPDDDRVDVINL